MFCWELDYDSWFYRMNIIDRLKVNPANYVEGLHSPIGTYLRREILQKEVEADRTLKRKLSRTIVEEQSVDGSWDQLFVKTANNLWNLALLGYTAEDSSIRKGLEWLLSIQKYQYEGYPGFFYSGNKEDPSMMRSMLYGEFGPGCSIFYQTTYAIHLFHIFGFDANKRVQRVIRSYLRFWKPDWCGTWCTINVLRVLIEHPLSKESHQVVSGLKYLAKRQTERGTWNNFPFYHTVHALSRRNKALGKIQLEKAIPLIVKRQNQDGSWGRKARETKTFLVLDAIKNIEKMI